MMMVKRESYRVRETELPNASQAQMRWPRHDTLRREKTQPRTRNPKKTPNEFQRNRFRAWVFAVINKIDFTIHIISFLFYTSVRCFASDSLALSSSLFIVTKENIKKCYKLDDHKIENKNSLENEKKRSTK
jgi:hypothetical protein